MLKQAECDPGAVEWIQRYFGDCVYNARDLTGFAAGLASICCWFVAQMPQLVRNYKTQSAEALSAWFLAEWLLGDTFNLLGALLKGDQLPSVVFTAQYFVCVDAVMMVQYIYYTSLQRRRERMMSARRHRHSHQHRRHHRHAQQQRGSGIDGGSGSHAPSASLSSGQERHDSPFMGGRGGGSTHSAAPDSALAEHAHVGGEIATSSGTGSLAGVGGSGLRAPAVVAGDVAFRPQRALACLGALLLVTHLQPTQHSQQQHQITAPAAVGAGVAGSAFTAAAAGGAAGEAGSSVALLGSRHLLQVAGMALGTSGIGSSGWGSALSYTAGTVLAYCSSLLYLTSRLSQIWKNHKRRSAEGLAISMFLCAVAANSLYGASILVRSYTWAQLRSSLPWLVGSLGTVALDLSIFAQYRLLRGADAGAKHHPSDEDEPLLQP